MMPIEKQVLSLELSKKLKELGVKQESLFYWQLQNFNSGAPPCYSLVFKDYVRFSGAYISAFTCAEIGEMLPEGILTQKSSTGFICHRDYMDAVVGLTESDARAKMLIYLLENNLMGKERG